MNQEVTRSNSLSSQTLLKFLPFLRWFPLRGDTVKADLIAGITVALVLIPQSMAYAQLAGLPAYYGLYAAFLPGIIAAMWGSSAQLATGPVAVASLLTASALAPLAATGSDQFIALAILLALLVGIIQLALGVFKLGVVVNFLSHPVIVGFTNAAAIIIGLSQLNKIFGVSMGRSEHFIQDIWGVAASGRRHPSPHPDHGRCRLRHHVGPEEICTQTARRADRRRAHHPGELGNRLRAQQQGQHRPRSSTPEVRDAGQ